LTTLRTTEIPSVVPLVSRRWWTGPRVTALGMLILQLTWVLAVPPFRGSDEFDHVYRAAAAARGQIFVAPEEATRGTGAWLEVPNDIVRAAQPQCEILPYTHDEDCVGTQHGGTTRIASGAGRYFPAFYAVIGAAALPFHGHTAFYVMRLATVMLSWLLFCLALGATRRWARTLWPTASLAVASTPVLVFSASIVAPNGIELMAALALWMSVLGLLSVPDRHDRYLAIAAAVSGSVLVTTRSLGPIWCLLILLTALVATRPSISQLKVLLSRTTSRIAAAVVLVATIVSTVWILTMHTFNIGQSMQEHISTAHRLRLVMEMEVLWVLQSIAAFPFRDQQTKTPVYACYLVLFVGLLYLGFRVARPPVRLGIGLALFVAVAFPTLSALNPDTYPGLWQGRYGLPYAVGIVVFVGFALERSGHRLTTRLRIAVLGLFVVAQAIGPADVLRQGQRRPLSDYGEFPHPATFVIVLSAAIGAGLLWWAASRAPERAGT
jgi:hypothetical protein